MDKCVPLLNETRNSIYIVKSILCSAYLRADHTFTDIQSNEIDTNWKQNRKNHSNNQLFVKPTHKTIFRRSFRQLTDVNEEFFLLLQTLSICLSLSNLWYWCSVSVFTPHPFRFVFKELCSAVLYCAVLCYVMHLFFSSRKKNQFAILHTIEMNCLGIFSVSVSLSTGKCIYLSQKKGSIYINNRSMVTQQNEIRRQEDMINDF